MPLCAVDAAAVPLPTAAAVALDASACCDAACFLAKYSTAAPLRATNAAKLSISLRRMVSVGGGTSDGGKPVACLWVQGLEVE